jgi:hypothetical protein
MIEKLLQYLQGTCKFVQIDPYCSAEQNLYNNLGPCLWQYHPPSPEASTMPLCEDLDVLWALGLLIWDLKTEFAPIIINLDPGYIIGTLLLLSHFMSRGTFRWAHFMMQSPSNSNYIIQNLFLFSNWYQFLLEEIGTHHNILAIYWLAQCSLELASSVQFPPSYPSASSLHLMALNVLDALLVKQDVVICSHTLASYFDRRDRQHASKYRQDAADGGDMISFLKIVSNNILGNEVPPSQFNQIHEFFDRNGHVNIYRMFTVASHFYQSYYHQFSVGHERWLFFNKLESINQRLILPFSPRKPQKRKRFT